MKLPRDVPADRLIRLLEVKGGIKAILSDVTTHHEISIEEMIKRL